MLPLGLSRPWHALHVGVEPSSMPGRTLDVSTWALWPHLCFSLVSGEGHSDGNTAMPGFQLCHRGL